MRAGEQGATSVSRPHPSSAAQDGKSQEGERYLRCSVEGLIWCELVNRDWTGGPSPDCEALWKLTCHHRDRVGPESWPAYDGGAAIQAGEGETSIGESNTSPRFRMGVLKKESDRAHLRRETV